jgi:DNA-binding LytR/AlgR family response regulator
VQENMALRSEAKLIIRNRGAAQAVPYSEILYFENRGHKAVACLQDKTYEINDSLESVRSVLPANFLNCHKSYSVNMDHIRIFNDSRVILTNGAEVPVSRARFATARSLYFRYTRQSARSEN